MQLIFRSILSGALVAATVVTALATLASATEQELMLNPEQIHSLGIRTAHPVPSPTDQTVPFSAAIVIPTPHLWVVSTPIAGMVTSLAAARGEQVLRGQPLVTMESPAFVSLQRDYLHALAQDALQNLQLRRNRELLAGRAVPQRVVEASETEARQADIALTERRQMLRLSGMSEAALARLTDEAAISPSLTVVAPESGTIVDFTISPGVRLEQSSPLLKIARLSPLWVEIAVPATTVGAVKVGARVDVEGYDTPGKVVLVSATTDPATQTVLVRAEIANDGTLRPGQAASARIGYASQAESAWQIPAGAMARRGETASVFVATEAGFRIVPVKVIAEDQDHLHVFGALTSEDALAVSGLSALRGMLLGLGSGE
ncbi:secretion protein HlyD [Afipia carboxidovorans OM5]|uniref:Membrane fusion protein n=1 Tax=Afipia carboxidovorans (strain ATCC 49405 / DSM 1227 / KCTC 32145 / OM5) TaxID=504832 RepID=B6JJF9_AFIC5|nr:efflux RND transporter periplasmic adaptor subunit [Afipia carboxidovorans]ACI94553.1 secretion protein HlyD [Afipia carboxidovorans OM5]AEI01830.1 membrane fusion protein [Afipia carboxidovorans OM4]AEI05405.1 membrane fusion protein [Afipia carboxidovorans OM5]